MAAVASKLIAQAGLEAVTIRDVAQAAGCSTAIVSHYFHNKRELLLFTYRHSIESATARADHAMGPGADDLKGYIAALLPLDEERRTNWKIWFAFWAKATADHEVAAIQRDCVRRTRGDILKILDSLDRHGGLYEGVDRPALARRILVSIMGLAVQAVYDPQDWTVERQVEYMQAELRPHLKPEPLKVGAA
ncbi:TetR/AcrR family transcriptional regulator [Phenylobacterium montanum]|uniref:TetR/AcrR family transcriptional regulator n=1 Tax=Phenylobacterium montanum TaxID=2823693 RepID=A0A975IWY8_9CAUL|nr:TetR/AcrR family transcriptional regulator [Caulobacter sp. S6]QUD90393.1 TetR/AcrR family transcriptional regulator [Caulobacter sp. S6]